MGLLCNWGINFLQFRAFYIYRGILLLPWLRGVRKNVLGDWRSQDPRLRGSGLIGVSPIKLPPLHIRLLSVKLIGPPRIFFKGVFWVQKWRHHQALLPPVPLDRCGSFNDVGRPDLNVQIIKIEYLVGFAIPPGEVLGLPSDKGYIIHLGRYLLSLVHSF